MPGSGDTIQSDHIPRLCTACKTSNLPTCSFPSVPSITLRMNHTPSDMDVARTMMVLQEEEQELQRVLRALEKLEVEKEVLNRKMEERRSWLAPVRRLPTEILSKIFVEVSELSEYSLDVREDDVRATALVLSHVSYHWRSVAVMQQSIWSKINFDIRKMTKDSDLTSLLQTYIDNAAAHPLTISVSDLCDVIPPHPTVHDLQDCLGIYGFHFLNTLIRHFPQSQVIRLCWIGHALSYTEQKDTAFPLLRSFIYVGNGTVNCHFWEAVRSAPALRNVVVASNDWTNSGPPVPWSQLTTLTTTDVTHSHFRFILTHCPQLETLTLNVSERASGTRSANTREPVAHPSLQHVHVYGVTDDDDDLILSGMTLPSLKTLYTYTPVPQNAQLMIERSSCFLTKLYMHDISRINESSTTLLKIFEHSPRLEHLDIRFGSRCERDGPTDSNADEESDIYKLLTILSPSSTQPQALLTRLKALHLHEHHISFTVSFACSILDIVEERRLSAVGRMDISALQEVLICTTSGCEGPCTEEHSLPAVKDRLTALAKNGIKCYLSSTFEV